MSLIKFDENEWKVLSSPEDRDPQLQTGYRWMDYVLEPSPSGRFAAFKLMKWKNGVAAYIIYVVDLHTGDICQYHRSDGKSISGNGLISYWLNDYEMMIHSENKKTHTQYRLGLDHTKKEFIQIAEREEFIPDFQIYCVPQNGAVCFLFRNSEYLLVPGNGRCLLKPGTLSMIDEQVQPTIVVDIWGMIEAPFENSNIIIASPFGYKEKIYYIVESDSVFQNESSYKVKFFDRFLCIDLTKRTIENGTIQINKEEATFFRPGKIGRGTFQTGLWCSASQQGHIVIISEHFFIHSEKKNGLRFWILNLEEETIQERLVTSNMLFKVTPFRNDGLMLWRTPDHMIGSSDSSTALKCSPIPRNDIIPQLKTICATKIILSHIHRNTPVLGRFLFG